MSCAACGEPAPNRCSLCGSVRYCSRECQRNDWAFHKLRCGAAKASVQPVVAWAEVLPADSRASWLVDCFRMRLTDVFASGGEPLGSPYAPGTTRWEAVMELLIFARLASIAAPGGRVLPSDWSWDSFLAAANPAISEALPDTDARERYGPASVATMRFVASVVYGAPADEGERSAAHKAAEAAVRQGAHGSSVAWLADASLFAGVGGAAAWSALLNGLPPVRCVADAGRESPEGGDSGDVGGALGSRSAAMASSRAPRPAGVLGARSRSDAWKLRGAGGLGHGAGGASTDPRATGSAFLESEA